MVLGYVNNVQDAEEVVQDTLMATLNGLDSFKHESQLRTWVYRIAINKSKDFLKHRNRQKRKGNIVSMESIEAKNQFNNTFMHPGIALESKEKMELLYRGIDSLPEQQKEALMLTKFEQMSMKEASSIMDTTAKAVESLLSRARKNLKEFLVKEESKNI